MNSCDDSPTVSAKQKASDTKSISAAKVDGIKQHSSMNTVRKWKEWEGARSGKVYSIECSVDEGAKMGKEVGRSLKIFFHIQLHRYGEKLVSLFCTTFYEPWIYNVRRTRLLRHRCCGDRLLSVLEPVTIHRIRRSNQVLSWLLTDSLRVPVAPHSPLFKAILVSWVINDEFSGSRNAKLAFLFKNVAKNYLNDIKSLWGSEFWKLVFRMDPNWMEIT